MYSLTIGVLTVIVQDKYYLTKYKIGLALHYFYIKHHESYLYNLTRIHEAKLTSWLKLDFEKQTTDEPLTNQIIWPQKAYL